MSEPRPRLVANLALLACSVLLFAAGLEGALRVIFARSLDFGMEMWKYAVELKRPEADPQLSFAHVSEPVGFADGCSGHNQFQRTARPRVPCSQAGRRLPHRDAGGFHDIRVGRSAGANRRQDSGTELNRSGVAGYKRAEAINAGVGNYGTVQEVAHYKTYDRALRPDLVILQYFINDAEPVPRERTPGLLGRSYLLSFAISRYDALLRVAGRRPQWSEYYAGLYGDDRPGLRAAQDALRELAAITSQDGTRLLVTILPELHEINSTYRFAREHQKIKDVLSAQRTPVIELIDGLRGHGPESSLWVTPADPHPNGKANSLIAAQVMPWILENARVVR